MIAIECTTSNGRHIRFEIGSPAPTEFPGEFGTPVSIDHSPPSDIYGESLLASLSNAVLFATTYFEGMEKKSLEPPPRD